MGLLGKSLRTLLAAQRTSQLSAVRHASTAAGPNAKWFLYAIPPCSAIVIFLLPSYRASDVQPYNPEDRKKKN